MISLKDLMRQFEIHRWTYGVLWKVQPWYTLGLVACGFLAGITPVLLFVALRGLIDDQHVYGGKNTQHWLLLLMTVGIVEAVISLALKLFRNLLRERAIVDVNAMILKASISKPVAFFENPSALNRLEKIKSNSGERLVELIGRNSHVLASILQVITISVMLARIEPLILVVVPPCFIPYLWYQLQLGTSTSKELNERAQDRRRVGYFVGLLTSPNSLAETRLLGISDHLISKFRGALSVNRDEATSKNIRQFVGGAVFSVFCTVLFVWLIYRMLHGRGDDVVSLGGVVFFAGAAIRLRKSLEDATSSLAAIADHLVYASSVKSYLASSAESAPKPSIHPVETFFPEIRFDNVSFRYPGQEHPALDNISFRIHPGETIAIVGENGSGKSTLVKLIAGIYRPESGGISISGQPLDQNNMEPFYRKIAFVFQDFGRYSTTLLENVAYGNWAKLASATDDQRHEELAPAFTQAGLEKDLARMPQGENTVLGKHFGAYEPSGGVWQKIALARAFARRAPILIMDEPTSAIDARAEYELFRKIRSLSEGRTTILISHRFSTVSMASRIFVIDRGRLVEEGSHEELLAMDGRYAMLYNHHKKLNIGA
ncbi:MAG: ABC transporter ATP-binding protein [Pirellula sp.]